MDIVERRMAEASSLITALQSAQCFPHPVARLQVIETHISWVMLTGKYAYKIKKPVNLGFADFSTLTLRKRCCVNEYRLNKRLAPKLYLGVVAIRGSRNAPRIGGTGRVLEYAVKMRQFPQEALASRALKKGRFGSAQIDLLAAAISAFHNEAPVAGPSGSLGTPESVLRLAIQNFDQMLPLIMTAPDLKSTCALKQWTENEFVGLRAAMKARKTRGYVRECHGDLHLGNIALLRARPVPFDCIEFSEELRWIDVMSEVAFVVMDLEDRGRGDLGWRFVNRYLEVTGDYAGMAVFRFYLVYRALVRAKIHLMRSRQQGLSPGDRRRLTKAFREYLHLAERFASRRTPSLILTHGLSGSGKTTATQPLMERIGAIRLRSDLERKRLHGLAVLESSGSALGRGIYTRRASDAVYRRLEALARVVLDTGFSVLVDATFLRYTERAMFRRLAEQLSAPFLILDFRVPHPVLRARIAERHVRADDASEADLAVLERQIATNDPLSAAELAEALTLGNLGLSDDSLASVVVRRLRSTARKSGLHRVVRRSSAGTH